MNGLAAIPLEVRLAGVGLLGLVAGALANLATYRLAWRPRPISPWSRPPAEAPSRRWSDRIPVFGWFGLRRESPLLGRGFWVRPMLVEFLMAAGLPLLYWWEVVRQGLLPAEAPVLPAFVPFLHAEFAAHTALLWLMLVASLMDIDDRVIPDAITVPGTLLGLALALVCPRSLLPIPWYQSAGHIEFGFLTLASPRIWPDWGSALAQPQLLAAGLGCWWLACVAIMNRPWRTRRGLRVAIRLMWARLVRSRSTYWILAGGVAGSVVIGFVWAGGGERWIALLSALVGMAAAGGLVWIVRAVAFASLRQEGMGFGDVTLMFMLGAFLGWQTCLMVFFLAPLVGVVYGVLRAVLHREMEIYYGPFLSLAALFLVVTWGPVWTWAEDRLFILGWWIPGMVLACMALLGPLLVIVRGLRRLVLPDPE